MKRSESGMALLGLLIVLVIAYFLYMHYAKKPGSAPRGHDTSYSKDLIDKARGVKNKASEHKDQLNQTEKELGLQ